MKTNGTIDFEQTKVSTLFRRLFFPTLMGMLSVSAVTTIDGIFVGHGVGSDGIAAVNLCIPLLMGLTGVGLMVGAGCSVISSIYLSKGKGCMARASITQALLMVSAVTVAQCGYSAFPRAHGRFARRIGPPAAYGRRLSAVVHAVAGFRAVDSHGHVRPAARRCAAARHVVLHSGCGGKRGIRLAVHIPLALGRERRGARHVCQLPHRGADGRGLSGSACRQHAAASAPGQLARCGVFLPQHRRAVQDRLVGAARRGDDGGAYVHGQPCVHEPVGRRRRGSLRRELLLPAFRLHDGKRHRAVGTADNKL